MMLEKKAQLIEIKRCNKRATKFSIVIPTYKRSKTLKNTINSALSQDFADEYMITVVDNNPERNDETELFMGEITDSRVSYYKNETNVGMVNNWNQCIIAANSEWVVLVHDDDLLSKNCLKNIEDTIVVNPTADAILPNFSQKDNPYYKEITSDKSKKENKIKSIMHAICRNDYPIAANLFCDNIYGPPTCGLTLRKKAVIDFGGYSDRCIAADWDFMSNFSRTHKIVKSLKPTGTYLWSVNASMKESTMEQIRKDRILILKDIIRCSFVSRLYYIFLRKDFEKKFNSKTIDKVDYSNLYKLIKRYYQLRV